MKTSPSHPFESFNTLNDYLTGAKGISHREKHGLAPILYAKKEGTVNEITYIWGTFKSMLQNHPHYSLKERQTANEVFDKLDDITREAKKDVNIRYPGPWTKLMHTLRNSVSLINDHRIIARQYLDTTPGSNGKRHFPIGH